jgi:hypothetical protein
VNGPNRRVDRVRPFPATSNKHCFALGRHRIALGPRTFHIAARGLRTTNMPLVLGTKQDRCAPNCDQPGKAAA